MVEAALGVAEGEAGAGGGVGDREVAAVVAEGAAEGVGGAFGVGDAGPVPGERERGGVVPRVVHSVAEYTEVR